LNEFSKSGARLLQGSEGSAAASRNAHSSRAARSRRAVPGGDIDLGPEEREVLQLIT
jgi:hypothetical protein